MNDLWNNVEEGMDDDPQDLNYNYLGSFERVIVAVQGACRDDEVIIRQFKRTFS